MPRIIKNTLLNYLSNSFEKETIIKPERIFNLNQKPIKSGFIVYLCEREIRVKDNFALQFALQKSKELNLALKIIHPKTKYEYEPKQNYIDNQITQTKKQFQKIGLDFEIIQKTPQEILKNLEIAMLILDFNPILKRKYPDDINCKIYEIDGHNIVPARFVSDKQEYSASGLRRKIYFNIYEFLNEFENFKNQKTEGDYVLEDFIENKLQYYSNFKNDPSKNITSGLSKYLNLGFISSQRAAIEVIKSNVSDENKESFLEELIIRKELADNFCLYAKSFKNLSCAPNWAKKSLKDHRIDIRPYIYSSFEMENYKTHDKLWNSAQKQLVKEGTIQGYLRMYWAKKILEWTISPNEAIKIAIYLNDKYAYDSPSSNGYTGILWACAGLHDRAFRSFPIFGKVRKMTFKSIKRKYDIEKYIRKYF
ncbi:deoxyribodipyrimidine photolyase [bacterium]|nr:deoxyribodipyrimidine photolyase [bacterium]